MNRTWEIVVFGVVAVPLILELYAIYWKKMTLSQWVWETSKKYPYLPFGVGFAMGALSVHFWG
jgi:hypothetical protein